MSHSIDAAPSRKSAKDAERRSTDDDLFADDPFDRPLAASETDDEDWSAVDPAPTARRKKRVIVDDAYGWGDEPAIAADPEAEAADRDLLAETARFDADRQAAARSRRQRLETNLPAPLIDPLEPAEPVGAGGVWWWAILASLIWVGGVLAFSAGFFQLPVQPIDALIAEALRLDVKLQIMVIAAAVAPIGLIWMHALNARRARILAGEATRLTRLASKLSASAAQSSGALAAPPALGDLNIDPLALRVEVENAARALDDLDEKFAAAEDRAQISRERLQSEREHLAKLVREIEAEATRAEQEADRFRQASTVLDGAPRRDGAVGGLASDPEALAAMIAKALAAQGALAERSAAAPVAGAPSPAQEAPPAPRRAERESFAPYAAQTFEDRAPAPSAFEPDGFGEPGYPDDDYAAPPPRNGTERAGGTGSRSAVRASLDAVDSDEPVDEVRRTLDRKRSDLRGRETAAPPAPSLDWEKFIRAANFPDSEDDRETLEALYAVLSDRAAAALLQTAEDVLSTLADLNLFMEDMHVHHAPVELWRAYLIDGESEEVLDIGGVRDPHAIEDVEFALNERPEFAKLAKTFFEQYEAMASRLFDETDDPTWAVELADTRTGRAFMLMGRADGRFGD